VLIGALVVDAITGEGIDYALGTEHLVEGSHYVLATDEEFTRWAQPGAEACPCLTA